MTSRIEKDSMGEMSVPADAYYGAQTARAVQNFPVSGLKPHPVFVWGTVIIKKCAAKANISTGRLASETGDAIVAAADEVLANRALELMGRERGDFSTLHPNDHVNMAQSTNDVIPTAIRLASLEMLDPLLEVLEGLELTPDLPE